MTSRNLIIQTFRWVAIAEAISYLLLIIGMVGKYGFDQEVGVTVMGPIHGFLFIAYVIMVFVVWPQVKWSIGQVVLAILMSAIPLGTLWVERKMLPEERVIASEA